MESEPQPRLREMIFPCVIDDVSNETGEWRHAWTELTFDPSTGIYGPALYPRFGTVSVNYATELSGGSAAEGQRVWMRLKGTVEQIDAYEFENVGSSGSSTPSSGSATLTGSVDNYVVPAGVSVLYVSTTGAITITGLSLSVGRQVTIYNSGSSLITFLNLSSSSLAINQLVMPGGVSLYLTSGCCATFINNGVNVLMIWTNGYYSLSYIAALTLTYYCTSIYTSSSTTTYNFGSLLIYAGGITYNSTATLVYNSGSTSTYNLGSILIYAGGLTYNSGSLSTYNSGSTLAYSGTSNYASSALNTYASGSLTTFASGSVFVWAGATVNITASSTWTISSSQVWTIAGAGYAYFTCGVELCNWWAWCIDTSIVTHLSTTNNKLTIANKKPVVPFLVDLPRPRIPFADIPAGGQPILSTIVNKSSNPADIGFVVGDPSPSTGFAVINTPGGVPLPWMPGTAIPIQYDPAAGVWNTLTTSASAGDVLTTLGDTLYEDSTPKPAALAGNITSTRQFLSQTGTGSISAAPIWTQPADTDLSIADITTNNVTSSAHGFTPKSPADATKFLNGATTPGFAQVKDSDLSTSDITTSNVSTSKHGFTPKLPNDATKFLDGTGAYSKPTGSISGTTNTVAKFASSTSVGNSSITDDGSAVTTTATNGLMTSNAGNVLTGDVSGTRVFNVTCSFTPSTNYGVFVVTTYHNDGTPEAVLTLEKSASGSYLDINGVFSSGATKGVTGTGGGGDTVTGGIITALGGGGGLTVGTTTISGGTSFGVLYNNAGTLANVAPSTTGQMLLSGSIGWASMSGDATITSSGVLTIAANAVTSAKVNSSIIIAAGTNAFTGNQSLGSHKLTSVLDPTNPQDAATKNYVDSLANGLLPKQSCQCATAAALPTNTYLAGVITITATGTLTVDGHLTVLGDRVLVKNEAAGSNNGIYSVTTAGAIGIAAVLTRTADANTAAEIWGAYAYIEEGSTLATTLWANTNSSLPTFDVTSLTFGQIGGPAPTITLTSDVTGSGTGSFATTIAAGVVTLVKMANMATSSLIYRKTAGSGAPEVNTLATLKTDLGLTGTNSGDQTITLTGDVTGSGTGSFAATLASVATAGTTGSSTAIPVITINVKGLTTSITTAAVVAPAGTLTGSTLASGVTASSLTSFGASPTLSMPVFSGLPTGTGVASAATASTLAARDSFANLSANNFVPSYATTVTSVTTLVLTQGSAFYQYFTGTTNQTVQMPVESNLTKGFTFQSVNLSTGTITHNSSAGAGNTIITQVANSVVNLTCVLTSGSTAASWNAEYCGFPTVTGTGSLALATSPTFVTPALGTPASGNLANCTFPTLNQNTSGSAGSVAAANITGTTLASNVTASSLTSFGSSIALGTPASGVLTNCSGTAASLTAGNVTTNANLTGPVTSSGNATTLANIPAGFIRGMIDGLILSNDGGTPNSILDIAAGTCRDSTDAFSLTLAASTKTTGTTWASGTGNAGMDTGSIAASTWYHVWAISKAAGANPDILFSLSATAPTMPSTYTLKRRIGSFKTDGSSHIIAFVQNQDDFVWAVPVNDVTATNPGTSAVTRALTVPTGIKVRALLAIASTGQLSADNTGGFYVSDLAVTDSVPSIDIFSFYQFSGAAAANQLGCQAWCWTNTSAQVRSRSQISTANTSVYINTLGWTDPRGRNG